MNNKNPWRGLASYEEPQGGENDYLFCGREDETINLVRLIENNLFVTLYGSSGIGKTSLLKAGVIPILRRRDYFPVYVRLSQEPDEFSYAESIVRKLKNSGLKEESKVTLEQLNGNDRLYLWNYFAITRFLADGRECYPVVILDQFEEVFRDGDKAKVEILLQQIYLLLNDELEMPGQEGYSPDTNYRFVASIREDFLFVLEDSIDDNSLDLLKNNRFRLRPMKPEQARQVVLLPGKDCIDTEESDKVADLIVNIVQNKTKLGVDTLYLSLVCSEVFNSLANKNEKYITKNLIDRMGNNILTSFYTRTMNMVNPITVKYLESHLITQSGFRNNIALEDCLHNGIKREELSILADRQLIRIEMVNGIERVEFVHDAICSLAKDNRDRLVKKVNQKSKVIHGVGFLFDVLLPLLCIYYPIIHSCVTKQCNYLIIINNYDHIYVYLYYISAILLAFNAIMIIPYRHTQEGNSRRLLLLALLISVLSVFRVSPLLGDSDYFLILWFAQLIYIITQFFISIRFVRRFKFIEAFKYIVSFKLYKERPYFLIILGAIIVVMMLLTVVLSA